MSASDELRHRLTGDGAVPLHHHVRPLGDVEEAAESVEDLGNVTLLTKPFTALYIFGLIVRDWVAGCVAPAPSLPRFPRALCSRHPANARPRVPVRLYVRAYLSSARPPP